VLFGGGVKSVREGEKLIETKSARSDKRCRVKDDVVGDSKVVSDGNETTVKIIVRQSWAEIGTEKTEVVPGFSPSVVHNNDGAAWSNRVRDEVVGLTEDAMAGGDSDGQAVIRSEEIECQLGLGKKLRPMVDREGRLGAS
jgi:hypothetical protein